MIGYKKTNKMLERTQQGRTLKIHINTIEDTKLEREMKPKTERERERHTKRERSWVLK